MIQFRNICETMVCTKGESNSVEMKTYLTNTCKPLGKFTQYSVHTFGLVLMLLTHWMVYNYCYMPGTKQLLGVHQG